jgi:hypothetical protein
MMTHTKKQKDRQTNGRTLFRILRAYKIASIGSTREGEIKNETKRNETKWNEGRFGFFVKDTWLVGMKSSRVLNWGSPLAPGQKLTPRLMILPFCTIGQQLSVLNLTSKKKQLARLFKDFFCRELDITFFSKVWAVWRRLVLFATLLQFVNSRWCTQRPATWNLR